MMSLTDYVKDKIVMIVNEKNEFGGTGFFIQKEYCVTCHHNICRMREIRVGKENNFYDAQWMEQFSDTEKDIAVLKIKNTNFNHFELSTRLLRGLDVIIWGFPKSSYSRLTMGKIEYGRLYEDSISIQISEEQIVGDKKWNKKPFVKMDVFEIDTNPGLGFSGSPVFYRRDPIVVGIYEAFDEDKGYVIPIETIVRLTKQERERDELLYTNIISTLDDANELFKKGKYDEAINHYNSVINDPSHRAAWNNKGKSLTNLGKFDEAIKCYDRALEIDPNYAFAWNYKGITLYELRKYDEAIKSYDKAINIDPNYAFAWSGKGEIHFDLCEFTKALTCFEKALGINQNYARAWSRKGQCLEKLGQKEESIECYRRALEIYPDDPDGWNTRGFDFNQIGKFTEAIESLNNALEINPKHTRALVNKGYALSRLGKFTEAIECYEKIIIINPRDAHAWYYKGLALRQLGRIEESTISINKALEINPYYEE
jgi:tetratricopeptide (TPR) repeat protein